ncbi:hypothetical protein LINPERPRIM_LOCUS34000 [Linum perenne]
MKSVTGKINSVTPVSVSRAAYIHSNFVDADTGASQAVTAYLRRATAAFNELVQFHSKSHERRYEKHKSDITEAAGPTTCFANTVDDEPTQRIAQSKPAATAERNEQDSNDNNNKKKKSKHKSVVIEEEQCKGEGNVEVEEESVNKKKKKKSRDEKNEGLYVKGEEAVNPDANLRDLGRESDEQRKKKKKDKSKTKENGEVDGYRENGGSIGNHEGTDDKRRIKEEEKSELLKVKEENRKKRKSSEAEEERRDDQSEERPRKKRK